MLRRNLFIIMLIAVCCCALNLTAAEDLEDVVYLKNGSVVRGTIVEQIPGTSLTIQTGEGSSFVFQMPEVTRIAKEAPLKPARSLVVANGPKAGVLSLNPIGLFGLGLSWIGFEREASPNVTYQMRLDIFNLKTNEEDDGGYVYHESENGFGVGVSARGYLPSSTPMSGLFGAFGMDAVYTTWTWDEQWSSTAMPESGNGTTMAWVFHSQVGYAIPISNVRLEPSLIVGYFLTKEKGESSAGVVIMPALQIGVGF